MDNATAPTTNATHNPPFKKWMVLLPIAIGISVIVLMFMHEARREDLYTVLRGIRFDWRTCGCLLLAVAFMMGRDFGLSWRFRALTNRQLSWWQAWKVDFLCEFTSCVTPSAVGGSSLGMVFLNTQGIEFGRATTLMMTTLLLDELFFVVACPFYILLTPDELLFASQSDMFSGGLQLTFWIVYSILALWTLLLFVGIILKPEWVRRMLKKVTSLRPLRRFQSKAVQLGDNMVATSAMLRTMRPRFWIEVFIATALSWTSRFLVVNALFLGFAPDTLHWQWVILARQFIIWVVLMVSPTPGGSGLSEWLFSEYYDDILSGSAMVLVLAVFWRIISYYVYLVIGAIIVPGWLKSSYEKFHPTAPDTTQS